MRFYSYLFAFMIVSGISFSCHKKEKNDPVVDPTDYDQDKQSLINAGWMVQFEDDFSSDFSKWNIWQGGAYNNEYQCYTNDPSNLSINNGILTINAKRETVTGPSENGSTSTKSFDFTSGRIEAKSTISANSSSPKVRVSARIKLPDGLGMWPAFWSYGANWPSNGEIDIMEARGNQPTTYGTNYFYGATAQNNQVYGADKTITSSTSLTQHWHVYEVIWEQNSLTYYLDGNIVDTKVNTTSSGQYIDDMFGKVQNVTFNLAVGGIYTGNPAVATIVPGTMYVDWVRVYHQM